MSTEQMRKDFEAVFPLPADCIWCGNGYAATSYNAWDAHKHIERWKGWQAALATQPQAPQGAVNVERVANDIAAWAMDGSRPDEWKLREWETNLRAAMRHPVGLWQPIETAPKETMVLVYTPPQDGDWPDSIRISFDHIPEDSDCWHDHWEHYEHYMMVGGPNAAGPDVVCTGPSEKAPYTHWMPLPAAPETPEGKK